MKKIIKIKKLYKKDSNLAIKTAKVLGYTITSDEDRAKEFVETLTRLLFNQINKYANSKGVRFKSTADDFANYMSKFLQKKLQ